MLYQHCRDLWHWLQQLAGCILLIVGDVMVESECTARTRASTPR